MIAESLVVVLFFAIGIVVGMLTKKGHCHHWDDGTDRYNLVPFRKNDSKLGVTKKTVYRCQCEDCYGEKTEEQSVTNVHREQFEEWLQEQK